MASSKRRAAPAAKRGLKATPTHERAIAKWKGAYIESKQAELKVKLARSVVNGIFDQHQVDYINSKLGTFARRESAPSIVIVTDWEALARKLLTVADINANLPTFTTTTTSGGSAPVLAAPSSWTVEAGC